MSGLEIFLSVLAAVGTLLSGIITHKYNEKSIAINVAGVYKELVDTLTQRVDKLEEKHQACEENSEKQAKEIKDLKKLINNNNG